MRKLGRRGKIAIIVIAATWVTFIVIGVSLYALTTIQQERYERAEQLTGGDARLGLVAMERYGCAACHHIPELPRAGSTIGPSLAGIGTRTQLAGGLANNPENLMRWIMNPSAVDPKTAMPNVGVTEADARNIAAYLYSME